MCFVKCVIIKKWYQILNIKEINVIIVELKDFWAYLLASIRGFMFFVCFLMGYGLQIIAKLNID